MQLMGFTLNKSFILRTVLRAVHCNNFNYDILRSWSSLLRTYWYQKIKPKKTTTKQCELFTCNVNYIARN